MPTSPSTNSSTPACSTRTATSTSSWSTPRPARRHADAHHRAQPRPRGRAAARAAAALVPQHLELGAQRPRAIGRAAPSRATATVAPACWPPARRPGADGAGCDAEPVEPEACCSPRTTPTCARLYGTARRRGFTKDAFHDYVVHGNGTMRSTPRGAAPRRVPLPSLEVPAGRQAPAAPAPCRRRARSASRRSGRTFDALMRGARRGRRVLRRVHGEHRRCRSGGVQRQAFAGHDLEQAVLLLRRARVAARRSRPAAAAGAAPRTAATATGAPLQRRHHLDAGQVGVPLVRGLGPGVPLHARWRWSIPSSPRSSCCC
jgi:hypothetical protein